MGRKLELFNLENTGKHTVDKQEIKYATYLGNVWLRNVGLAGGNLWYSSLSAEVKWLHHLAF